MMLVLCLLRVWNVDRPNSLSPRRPLCQAKRQQFKQIQWRTLSTPSPRRLLPPSAAVAFDFKKLVIRCS